MQCIVDGKSIIMEGMHLDPGLYLYEFARYSQAHLSEKLSQRRPLKARDLQLAQPSYEHDPSAQASPPQATAQESCAEDELRCVRFAQGCLPHILLLLLRDASSTCALHWQMTGGWVHGCCGR